MLAGKQKKTGKENLNSKCNQQDRHAELYLQLSCSFLFDHRFDVCARWQRQLSKKCNPTPRGFRLRVFGYVCACVVQYYCWCMFYFLKRTCTLRVNHISKSRSTTFSNAIIWNCCVLAVRSVANAEGMGALCCRNSSIIIIIIIIIVIVIIIIVIIIWPWSMSAKECATIPNRRQRHILRWRDNSCVFRSGCGTIYDVCVSPMMMMIRKIMKSMTLRSTC